MPQLARITATFFTTLINRLGIRPPFDQGFEVSNVVQPVSIVDSDIAIPTVVTPPIFGTPFSNGDQVAPAVNTVLADTGALVAGNWVFTYVVSFYDAGATVTRVAIQHRDAANAANIWEQNNYTSSANGRCFEVWTLAKTVAAGERMRIINLVAGAAGTRYQGQIFALQLS